MSNILTHKRCSVCGETKPVSEFYKKGNGYRFQCKACNKKYSQDYFKKHIAEFKRRSARWVSENLARAKEITHRSYILHKREVHERSKAWYLKHPDMVNKWAKENKEKHQALVKLWDSTHKEEKAQHSRARRARKINAGGHITAQQWMDLKAYYNYTCLCCGKKEPEIKLTLDHVKPLAIGGSHTIENAQPLCKSCNSSKHIKEIDYR